MLTFKNVTYKIKKKTILNNISFNVKDGEKVLLMGESGSGKSTIFNLILKNIKPNSGNIYYLKEDIELFSSIKTNQYRQNKVIMIYQSDDLFDNLTVKENLCLFYYESDAIKCLKKAGLIHLKDRFVYSLSGGERQRIAIIKACLASCEILLCDEITSALDYSNSEKIIDFVIKMFKNKTIFFISHDKSLFINKIDHFLYIENNKLIKDILINDVNKIVSINSNKKKKTLLNVSIKQGFKKLSIASFLLFIISIICFFITLYFNDIFTYFAFKSYSKYFDYDVLFIKDNIDIKKDNKEIFNCYSKIFEESIIQINNKYFDNIKVYPFNNKNNYTSIVINQKLLNTLNIEDINQLKISNKYFDILIEKIDIISENNMFTTPCMYYDILYFNSLVNIESEDLIIINYDFTQNDGRFTNNPLFIEKKENKPYLDSKAYNDYLTFEMIFDSINEIVNYYFVITFLYVLLCSILVNISKMLKDIKVIAIYISRGYNDFEIIISYIIPVIIYLIVSMILIILIKKIIIPLLITFLIQCLTIVISYYMIKRKKLHNLLKAENLS